MFFPLCGIKGRILLIRIRELFLSIVVYLNHHGYPKFDFINNTIRKIICTYENVKGSARLQPTTTSQKRWFSIALSNYNSSIWYLHPQKYNFRCAIIPHKKNV